MHEDSFAKKRTKSGSYFLLAVNKSMSDSVAILLATYNGSKYIQLQLDSLAKQSYKNWYLLISDDGSTDSTLDVVKSFQDTWGKEKVRLFNGPKRGSALNFMFLLKRASGIHKYFAFCDQDDIWDPDKLDRSLTYLETLSLGTPGLYGGHSRIIDAEGNFIGKSPLFRRKPSFQNALVQSIMGGNTMVMNDALRCKLIKLDYPLSLPSHDWWCYIVVTGVGGVCYYDPVPSVRYRQHVSNQVGANTGFSNKVKRLQQLMKGRFRFWTDSHLRMLLQIKSDLTADSLRTLGLFVKIRKCNEIQRIIYYWNSGIYRQSAAQTVMLFIAILIKRI